MKFCEVSRELSKDDQDSIEVSRLWLFVYGCVCVYAVYYDSYEGYYDNVVKLISASAKELSGDNCYKFVMHSMF